MAKKGKTAKKRGRKTIYKSHYPDIVEWMARNGLIQEEIARELKIGERTLRRWKKEYPGFATALKKGADYTDGLVENSLLKRAMGYSYDEVKKVMGETAKTGPFKRIETVKKQICPDVLAQIFWLKNRQPARWRDVQHKEITGEIKGGFNIITHPEEEGV